MILSVLLSVYYKEVPDYLNECLNSLYHQTRSAEEIICVKDGNLTPALDSVLEKWKTLLPLKIIGYETNKGLAYALNLGMQYCSGDYIARMDTDDIAVPERFEKQVEFINRNPNVVLFSSYVAEFTDNPDKIKFIKKVPISNVEISDYIKRRNPFNHMAVCLKKDVIINAGNYQAVPFFEDYDLWMRVVQKRYPVANIPEVLVKARIGNNMIGRRHGLDYAKKEIFFFKRQLQAGFITKIQYVYLLCMRVPLRLLPRRFLNYIYIFLRNQAYI